MGADSVGLLDVLSDVVLVVLGVLTLGGSACNKSWRWNATSKSVHTSMYEIVRVLSTVAFASRAERLFCCCWFVLSPDERCRFWSGDLCTIDSAEDSSDYCVANDSDFEPVLLPAGGALRSRGGVNAWGMSNAFFRSCSIRCDNWWMKIEIFSKEIKILLKI